MFSNNTKKLQVFLLKITYMRHHFFNWDSLQVGLNSHYDAWEKRNTKTLKHTGNLFRKNNFYLSHPRETELWKTNFHRNIKSNNAVFPCIKELKFRKCEDKFSTRIILAKAYEYQYLQIWQTLWNKVTLISKVSLIGHGSYENFFLSVHGNCVQLLKDAEATCLKIAIEMKKCSRLKEMSNFNVLWNFQPI